MGFSPVVKGNHSCIFSLMPQSMLTLWQTPANSLGTSTWRDSSPKKAILTTLPAHCLHF